MTIDVRCYKCGTLLEEDKTFYRGKNDTLVMRMKPCNNPACTVHGEIVEGLRKSYRELLLKKAHMNLGTAIIKYFKKIKF